jgi:hypothetical protein
LVIIIILEGTATTITATATTTVAVPRDNLFKLNYFHETNGSVVG